LVNSHGAAPRRLRGGSPPPPGVPRPPRPDRRGPWGGWRPPRGDGDGLGCSGGIRAMTLGVPNVLGCPRLEVVCFASLRASVSPAVQAALFLGKSPHKPLKILQRATGSARSRDPRGLKGGALPPDFLGGPVRARRIRGLICFLSSPFSSQRFPCLFSSSSLAPQQHFGEKSRLLQAPAPQKKRGGSFSPQQRWGWEHPPCCQRRGEGTAGADLSHWHWKNFSTDTGHRSGPASLPSLLQTPFAFSAP